MGRNRCSPDYERAVEWFRLPQPKTIAMDWPTGQGLLLWGRIDIDYKSHRMFRESLR